MKTPYRFIKRKGRKYIQVTFAHIPDVWFSTGTDSMLEAILFAESKLREVESDKKDITLKQFATGFFTEKDPHGYRHRLERRNTTYEESYFEQHQARLDNYILKAHGSYLLSSIKDTLIEDFIIDLPKIANSTKNKVLACYRIVLQEAVREGLIEKNPAKEVLMLPENNKSRESFTAEEMALLFPTDDEELINLWNGTKERDGLKYGVYFLIQRDTGWRPSEVSALSKADYFPELHGIYTSVDVNWKTHTLTDHIKTTKKGQKFKVGILSEQAERLLKRLIEESETDYLFPLSKRYSKKNDKIQFIYSETANAKLITVCKALNIELGDRTQYCFRHTFNTQTIGVLPEQARLLLMGHKKYRPEYDHLTPEESIKRVQDIIKKG